MPDITIDDMCLLDLNQVTSVSDACLQPDPACPLDALLRSDAVYNPQDDDFTKLANGDLVAADFAGYDKGTMYSDAEDGNGCATDCVGLDKFDQRAFQVAWKKCVGEDAMARWCKGANPVADPFDVLVSNNTNIRTVENTKRILAGLGGIAAAAAADTASGIYCDFAVESYDTTPHLSIENMGLAISDLAVQPDYWLADKYTVRRLRGQGFLPFCCGDDGQVFNQVAELQDPNGIPILTMDDEYAEYFDPANDGSTMMIGVQRNSIGFLPTSENDTSERGRGFRQLAFSPYDPCGPTKLYMNERAALHFKGFSYTGAVERCVNPITKAQLLTAGTNAYAPAPNARSGWDKSGFVFIKGQIPNRKAPV